MNYKTLRKMSNHYSNCFYKEKKFLEIERRVMPQVFKERCPVGEKSEYNYHCNNLRKLLFNTYSDAANQKHSDFDDNWDLRYHLKGLTEHGSYPLADLKEEIDETERRFEELRKRRNGFFSSFFN